MKTLLNNEIFNVIKNKKKYCNNPNKDFTINRKISMENVIKSVMCFEGKSLGGEIMEFFNYDNVPSTSAFIQ